MKNNTSLPFILRLLTASQVLSLIGLFCLTLPAINAETIFDRRKERSGPLELARTMLAKDPNAAKSQPWIKHTEQAYLALEQMEKEMLKQLKTAQPQIQKTVSQETIPLEKTAPVPTAPAIPMDDNDTFYYGLMFVGTLVLATSIVILCHYLRSSFQTKEKSIEAPKLVDNKTKTPLFSWLQKENRELETKMPQTKVSEVTHNTLSL